MERHLHWVLHSGIVETSDCVKRSALGFYWTSAVFTETLARDL